MKWNDITSTDYWTGTYGTYAGGVWASGDFGGYQFVVLSPGSWAAGYSALKLRVTYSLSALALTVVGSLSFVYDASVDSGDEVDLSAIGDLTAFQFGGTETLFTVSKIEIYGESLEEEEPVVTPTVTPGTSETWRLRYRPGSKRGRKHFPLKTGSKR